MKVIFIISERFNGKVLPLLKEFTDYQSAEKALKAMPAGRYQIEKIFVQGEEEPVVDPDLGPPNYGIY